MGKFCRVLAACAMMTGLLALPVSPASAAPGHVTLNCNTYASTGWDAVGGGGDYRGDVCMTIRHDGDHVDVTYWIRDENCDGVDLFLSRELSYDGPEYLGSPSGCNTSYHSNKQYDIVSDSRWARAIGQTDILGGGTYYTNKLYW